MTIFVLNTMITGKHNEMCFYYYHFPRSLGSAHPPWQWLLVIFCKGEIWQPLNPSSKKIKTMLSIIFMASWHGAWTQILHTNSMFWPLPLRSFKFSQKNTLRL